MLKKVYRLEGLDGRGIYTTWDLNLAGEKLQSELHTYHTVDYSHARPDLGDDFTWKERDYIGGDSARSACESIDALKFWFDFGMFEKLIKNRSVKLVEYTTNEIVEGDSGLQVLFNIENAERREIRKGKQLLKY